MTGDAEYAELQVMTSFSFLEGASHAGELVLAAAALGHRAIAVADRNSFAGIVRMHAAAKEAGLRLVIGVRLDFTDAPSLLCYPTDRAAYGRLCRLLTLGRRRAEKGACLLHFADLVEFAAGQIVVALPPEGRLDVAALRACEAHLATVKQAFGDRAYLALQHLYRGDDERRIARLAALADRLGVPVVATNDVRYHAPERRTLHDVMTCVREGCTIDEAGRRLLANAERHLKPAAEMAALFRRRPDAVTRTREIVERCGFSLSELRYEYPDEITPDGTTPQRRLEQLTWAGAAERYPAGVPEKVRESLARELALIEQLDYARYFLTVKDAVDFARSREILCQGRGSAANSAVCYVLGITAVDPARVDVLFERFLSAARNEPPDIDVDFEHERREEVIQHIYRKYGRHRAGIAATVITYRPKSAIRDVGKALGLSADVISALSRVIWGWGREDLGIEHAREAGLDPEDPTIARALDLAHELIGFPRHLSQHVGGFVIARGRLDELVPIENAAMADRTVIEWDKDDLDELGLLKVDVLALGMLTCIRKCFEFIADATGKPFGLTDVPPEDPAVYDMLCEGDSIGVFQVESRAQMSMLPRLKPRTFYDLVIEVAIVRPGPIQGDMVHPYLKRRAGIESAEYPKPELRAVLEKTLGVPLFQEQAMQIAIVAAGFTPTEADRLRRAMATFRHSGTIHLLREKFIAGMIGNGYTVDFAERCFRQIEGFGEYGFPESHAASFALLVYVSAWLKRHHPAIFCAAMLNSQPMGFYAPAQLVRDAREHGVEMRPVDVNRSEWDCTLEAGARGPAVRLGFHQVKGLRESDAIALAQARGDGYQTLREAWRRSTLPPQTLERLADADAWGSLGLDRRDAIWQARALDEAPLPLFAVPGPTLWGDNRPPAELDAEPEVTLPRLPLGAAIIEDYRMLGLSLKAHPLALLRERLRERGILPAAALAALPDRQRVMIAGLVLIRQRPGTASGVVFATIEDETGVANIIIWPAMLERFRRDVLGARLLCVQGRLQREGIVTHVVGDRFADLSDELQALAEIDGPRTLRVADALPEARNFR